MKKKQPNLQAVKVKISEYFKECDRVNSESPQKIVRPYTMSGLCSHIGIMRDEFTKLEAREEYKPALAKAKLRIENYIEENVLTGKITATSAMCSLKYNFGWTDKPQKDGQSDLIVNFGTNAEYSE